jgi:hypothetical protein
MSRRFFVLAAVAAVILAAVVAVTVHDRPTIDVRSAEVTTGSITREVMTTGTLKPAKAVDAGTQVSGTIQSLAADFNTRVRGAGPRCSRGLPRNSMKRKLRRVFAPRCSQPKRARRAPCLRRHRSTAITQ